MTMAAPRSSRAQPLFLELNGRRLFALHITPTGPSTGAVLYLPPFAEEMNRCRSHVASMARALATTGQQCLLLDPVGTGESQGEITDSDWNHWRDDALAAARWLRSQGAGPLTLWGIRTGALLAAEVAAGADFAIDRLLYWQPVLDGKMFLNQYLRLRIASQLVNDADRETTEQIRERLSAGEAIEIAGYPLTGRLADALAARRLAAVQPPAGTRVDWIEVVAKPEQPMALPSRKLVDTWLGAGTSVRAETVACPMIWQLHRRDDAPQIEALTLRMMGDPP